MRRFALTVLAGLSLSFCCHAGNGIGESSSSHPVNDEFVLSWWAGAPAANRQKDLRGFALGLGSGFRSVRGAQVSLCMNEVQAFEAGAQVAIGYNEAKTLRNGCQIGIVDCADSAALQFGLLCFNKGGFLPFFVLFNFDKTAFGN